MIDDDDINSIGLIDCLFAIAMLFFFAMMAMSLMIQIKTVEQKAGEPPPGNLVVTVVWPQGDNDVDLWLMGPGEETPVGFSHRDGKVWSVLRDDLGDIGDSLPLNLENGYAREVRPGHYIINLHCYRCHVNLPIVAHVEVREANMAGGMGRQLVNTTVTLNRQNEEATVAAFDLDDTGAIVPGSLNNVLEPLHAEKK